MASLSGEVQFLLQIGGVIVGALAAYYGALSALKERLAKVESVATHALDSAMTAHDRIDRVLLS